MRDNIHQDIKNLENDILHIENKIIECTQHYENEEVRKSLGELRSDLKYLSVISNGAEIDKNEHREIMDFLLIHYNYWQDKMNHHKILS